MIREGREVRYRTDYIMGAYFRLFGNFSVQDPRHKSDHYMVLGYLHSASLREHARYLGERKRLPLCPLTDPTKEDRIFESLRKAVPKLRTREARKNVWIPATTWRLFDKRVSARQDIVKDQDLIQRLGHTIKASFQEDRKRRAEEAVAEVETLLGLDPTLHREASYRIKVWYKAVIDRAPPPARVTPKRSMADRVELYSYVPPPGTNIPIFVQPFPVEDSVPTEGEIEWAVTGLCNHRSGRGVEGAGTTPEEVSGGSKKGREGCDNNGEDGDDREQGEYGGSYRDGAYGGGQLRNGSEPNTDGVPGRETGGGGHVAGGGLES